MGLHIGAVYRPDHIGVWHAGVVENHFAVLVEAPAALVEDFADAHARRVARHQEHRGALPQRRVRVSARVNKKQLADAGIGDEAFLAVEDPVVAVAFRRELETGLGIVGRQPIVGARARLADALAEQERVVLQERLEEAALLLFAAGSRDQMAPLPALAEGF